MSTPTRFLVAAAIAAVVVGWLRWRDDGATMPEPAHTEANEPTAVAASAPSTIAAEHNAAELPPAAPPALDDETDALVRKTSDWFHESAGPQLVDHLVSKGLSRADSERAVAEVAADWVRCHIDATLALAEEQSVSRATVLAALDAQGLFAVPAPLDAQAAVVRGQACRFGVQQRIGIAPGEFGFRAIGR